MARLIGFDTPLNLSNETVFPASSLSIYSTSPTLIVLTAPGGLEIDYYGSFDFANNVGIVSRIVGFEGNATTLDIQNLNLNLATVDAASTTSDLFALILNGNDEVRGSSQGDFLRGFSGNDTVVGGAGDDYLSGSQGDDYVLGQLGSDFVVGEDGNDLIGGGPGNDYLDGGSGIDGLDGGDGDDVLLAGSGDDRVIADDGNDQLVGGDGIDFMGGGAGNDGIAGGSGNDVLDGSDYGNDAMSGESGDDILALGIGDDYATGGGGADLFYLRFGGVGQDTITDFYPGGGDHLHNDTTTSTEQLIAASVVTAQGTLITLAEGDTVLIVGASGIDQSWFA